MACLMRKEDTAEFVPRGDTAARQDGIASPDPDWLVADGQPAECRRVRVRPLNAEEIAGLPPGLDGIRDAAAKGLAAIDGKTATVADLLPEWQIAVGLLVLAVTGNPLIGRPFRWTEGLAAEEPSPASAPASS